MATTVETAGRWNERSLSPLAVALMTAGLASGLVACGSASAGGGSAGRMSTGGVVRGWSVDDRMCRQVRALTPGAGPRLTILVDPSGDNPRRGLPAPVRGALSQAAAAHGSV